MNTLKHYPKVLLFGHQFDNKTGLGITLSNLFANWPIESIAVMASSLNVTEIEKSRPCSLCIGNVKSSNISSAVYNNNIRNQIKTVYYKLGIPDLRHKWPYSDSQIEQAIKFNPDIVFCCLGSYSSMLDCKYLLKYLPKSNLVLYIVDDWINTRAKNRYFTYYWQKKNDKMFRSLLKVSSGLLSICQIMSDSYLKQYNKVFYPFHNPVDIKAWNKINVHSRYPSDVTSIIYTGKINQDTKDCLLDMAAVIKELNQNNGKYVFDVYSPNAKMNEHLFDVYPDCHVYPPIPHDQVPSVMKSYSASLLTLGFSNDSREYVRLSMPTKMTEYLVSGIPTILYCPEEIALAKYLNEKNCTISCFERDKKRLMEKVLLLNNKVYIDSIIIASFNLAKEHDVHIVRDRFDNLLCSFNLPKQ